MNCPFCQNQVLPKAYACGHCGRDLVPWLALMTDLEDRTKRLERLEKALGLPSQEGAFKMADGAQTAFVRAEPEPVLPHWNRLAVWVLVAWLGLLVAHWLLLFVYDASPLILRIVTMVLPLVLAMPANARGDVQFKSNAIMATLLAASSVAGMLALTAWLDDVPWLPENKRDWRETFEYTVAILLAWVTGYLVCQALNKGHRMLQDKRQAILAGYGGLPKITDVSEHLQKLAAAAAPVASGVVAAYSGLKSLLGEG